MHVWINNRKNYTNVHMTYLRFTLRKTLKESTQKTTLTLNKIPPNLQNQIKALSFPYVHANLSWKITKEWEFIIWSVCSLFSKFLDYILAKLSKKCKGKATFHTIFLTFLTNEPCQLSSVSFTEEWITQTTLNEEKQ